MAFLVRLGAFAWALFLTACTRHSSEAGVTLLPYPSCPGVAASTEQELASIVLRAGPWMRNQDVIERTVTVRRDCHRVLRLQQQWPLGLSDVEVVYDAHYRPLRVWHRTMMPNRSGRGIAQRDTRVFELQAAPPVHFVRRTVGGALQGRSLHGGRPLAVIGPGRGLLSAWLQAAQLRVGQKERGVVLDLRGEPTVRPATLWRRPDRVVADFGRALRVYTFYGRETVYADAHNRVQGDLAGLRPQALVRRPLPPAMPTGPVPDPTRL